MLGIIRAETPHSSDFEHSVVVVVFGVYISTYFARIFLANFDLEVII